MAYIWWQWQRQEWYDSSGSGTSMGAELAIVCEVARFINRFVNARSYFNVHDVRL